MPSTSQANKHQFISLTNIQEFSSQAKEEKSLGIQANVGRNQRDGIKIKNERKQGTGLPQEESMMIRHIYLSLADPEKKQEVPHKD